MSVQQPREYGRSMAYFICLAVRDLLQRTRDISWQVLMSYGLPTCCLFCTVGALSVSFWSWQWSVSPPCPVLWIVTVFSCQMGCLLKLQKDASEDLLTKVLIMQALLRALSLLCDGMIYIHIHIMIMLLLFCNISFCHYQLSSYIWHFKLSESPQWTWYPKC